ncbi:MAG TPA: hypothetical protein VHC21_02080 [Candidatus Saccharimonadales bacterium]|nr:hypothetical protein [Candidatus Saccharimonadales bacterium]
MSRESLVLEGLEVFESDDHLETAIVAAAERGYAYAPFVFTDKLRQALRAELATLPLSYVDRIEEPVNQGQPNEVRQRYEGFYGPLDSAEVPVARFVARALHERVQLLTTEYPELSQWQLNEAGYQVYRAGRHDGVSLHRDRGSDRLLAATITVSGASEVRIHEPLGAEDDYTNTRVVDSFRAMAGGVMLLRAAGLVGGAGGGQVLHEVLPPVNADRTVLNLRMRPVDRAGQVAALEI